MTPILDWCHHGPLKQWVQVEGLLAGTQLDVLPWCQTYLPRRILDHPTVGETWWIAQKAFLDFSITPTPSPLTPVMGNPAFNPDSAILDFRI